MYHLFDKDIKCDYTFVYDDSDRSVCYVSKIKLKELGVEFGETLAFYDLSIPFVKLQSLGWNALGINKLQIAFELCRYRVDSVSIEISLCLNKITGQFSVVFYFTRSVVWFKPSLREEIWSYISREDTPVYGSTAVIPILCPTVMVLWIMDLKSRGNFDGLMQSFDNLFGSNIRSIVSNIRGNKVVFECWGTNGE